MDAFTYWEGEKPAYIALCHESLLKQNWQFEIVGYDQDIQSLTSVGRSANAIVDIESLTKYLKDDYFWSLMPAHRADIIRVELLAALGGLWIDSDFIAMHSFTPIIESSEKTHALYYYSEKYGPTNGIIAAPREHSAIVEWRHKNEAVYRNLKRMGIVPDPWNRWTAFGKDQLVAVLGRPIDRCLDLGHERVQPIPYESLFRFFDTENVEEDAWTGCYGYMLYNTQFPPWFKALSRDEILKGPWLISGLFRRAIA